jgi:hypothetical protein
LIPNIEDPALRKAAAAPSVYIMGDVHGELPSLRGLLIDAGLICSNSKWTGGESSLWFTGDFFDRGPDGVGAVELVMDLQTQAAAAGGSVGALLGNHDVMILAARAFGPDAGGEWGDMFMRFWMLNGGQFADLGCLLQSQIDWLSRLPAMAKIGNVLLTHADSTFYTDYGRTVAEVNHRINTVLASEEPAAWQGLIEKFTQRQAFAEGAAGVLAAREFLGAFGGSRLIHGHSPIPLVTGCPVEDVRAPLVYADGLCVNVDAGLFMGAMGFVLQVPPTWIAE